MKLSCFQESTSLSCASVSWASAAAMKRLAQILAASLATACSEADSARTVAVPPVTHPPAVNPIAMVRAAAPTQDQSQTVLVGRYWLHPFVISLGICVLLSPSSPRLAQMGQGF